MLFQHKSYKRQQGVVIVVALFIVALVATMAYTMMARLERDTRRTMMIVRDVQAEQYAEGAILWAADQLRKPVVDALIIKMPVMTEGDYLIASTIYDMQTPDKADLKPLLAMLPEITGAGAYFLIETKVTIEKQHVVLYTLLERAINGQNISINRIWQSKGVG